MANNVTIEFLYKEILLIDATLRIPFKAISSIEFERETAISEEIIDDILYRLKLIHNDQQDYEKYLAKDRQNPDKSTYKNFSVRIELNKSEILAIKTAFTESFKIIETKNNSTPLPDLID